jgi:carboxyl-terminal processing protease
VSSLGDPYTAYIEPQYAKILEQDMTSKFEGIGATLRQTSGGAIQILRTFENSPASKGGVLPGDIIDAVNGTKVTGLSTYEVAALVRGNKGSKVTLTLRRAEKPKPFDLIIMRDEIVIPLVTSKMVGDGKIGYVSLFDFSQEAGTQLQTKLQELLKQNPKGIILDLRDNPGGLLSQAVDIGDIFLKQGVFIIERDNKGNEKRDYTTDKGIAQDIPMVVLVNSGSASAAEIVAGAIQDYGRGKLIGETTFGKGSVQLPQMLSNGGQLRVTIQRWYTPKNRGIHGTGIAPDFVVPRTAEDQQANRDPQLDAAEDYLLSGKTPAPTPIPTVPATATP